MRATGIAGLGKLYSNLAAAHLQMDNPHAALADCQAAIQVRNFSLPNPASGTGLPHRSLDAEEVALSRIITAS